MPQFNYDQPVWRLGQRANARTANSDSYGNELFRQVTTVTAGGNTGGTYTMQIAGEEGIYQVSVDLPAPASAAAVAEALALKILDDPDVLGLLVDFAYVPAAADFVLSFADRGAVYVVTFPSNPGGDLTQALTQAPGGTKVPLGVGIVQGSEDFIGKLPDGASTDADFRGIAVLNDDADINSGLPGDFSGYSPGFEMKVANVGDWIVYSETAVAKGGDVYMRIAAGATPDLQQLGAFRADADGGNAILISSLKFMEFSTSAAGLALIRANRP